MVHKFVINNPFNNLAEKRDTDTGLQSPGFVVILPLDIGVMKLRIE